MNKILNFFRKREEEPIVVGDIVTWNPKYEHYKDCKKSFDTPKKVISIVPNDLKYAGYAYVYLSDICDDSKQFIIVASAIRKVK